MTTSMITKCPTCGTLFRVTPEQLQARDGMVRCGRCMAVFDGAKALAAAPEPAGGAGEAAAPVQNEPAPVAPRARAARATGEDDFRPAPRQFTLEEDYPPEEAGARRGSRWWAAGGVLLGLLLVGQALYFHRVDLAARYPGLKPHLVRACEVLRCRVLPPQHPKQIAIEASDLQVDDPSRPGIIRLTATLRNHAGHDLGYPAVDLVLTNTKDHALARRIFLPREYLDRGKDIAAGIPGSAEVTIRLVLDTGDLNPAGFRLDLLPAPPP